MGLPECAKMLRGIVIRTQLDVFRRAFLDDPSARAYDGVVLAGFKGGTGKAPTRTRSPSVKCGRVLPRLPLDGDDDRHRGDQGSTGGGGGQHLGPGVAYVP